MSHNLIAQHSDTSRPTNMPSTFKTTYYGLSASTSEFTTICEGQSAPMNT